MSGSTTLADAFLAGDRDGIAALLTEETIFKSPVARYTTVERVLHLLTTIGGIVEEPQATTRLASGDEEATFFTGRVDGKPVDGVLHVFTSGGHCTEITLMLRPLDGLLAGVRRMREALGEDDA